MRGRGRIERAGSEQERLSEKKVVSRVESGRRSRCGGRLMRESRDPAEQGGARGDVVKSDFELTVWWDLVFGEIVSHSLACCGNEIAVCPGGVVVVAAHGESGSAQPYSSANRRGHSYYAWPGVPQTSQRC